MPYSVETQQPIVIPMEDDILHTATNNYLCNDLECPCHLRKAWNELQAVPSYVELQAYAWSHALNLEIES